MRGHSNFNQSITGIKTVTELKPQYKNKSSNRAPGKDSFVASGYPRKISPLDKSAVLDASKVHTSKDASMYIEPQDFGEVVCPTTSKISRIFSCPPEWKK